MTICYGSLATRGAGASAGRRAGKFLTQRLVQPQLPRPFLPDPMQSFNSSTTVDRRRSFLLNRSSYSLIPNFPPIRAELSTLLAERLLPMRRHT